jgi:ribosome maturation factor RimP
VTAPRPSGAQLAASRARLLAVIEPVVAAAGYDLEELTVKQAGRRHQVRLMIDGDGGVSLDVIASVSRAVSKALDAAEESGRELIAGEYQLEVSSPGVDRPLTLPRHWSRNVGRLVKVKAGDRTVTGRVMAVDANGVTLDVDGTTQAVNFDTLGAGRVQVEFNRMNEIADEELAEFTDDAAEDAADDGDEPGDDEWVDHELAERDDEDDEGER